MVKREEEFRGTRSGADFSEQNAYYSEPSYEFLVSNNEGGYTKVTFDNTNKYKIETISFKSGALSYHYQNGKVAEYVYDKERKVLVLKHFFSREEYMISKNKTIEYIPLSEVDPYSNDITKTIEYILPQYFFSEVKKENEEVLSKVKILVPEGYVLGSLREGKDYVLGVIYSRTEPNIKRGLLVAKKEQNGIYTISFLKKDMFPQEKYPENTYSLKVGIDQKDIITYSSYQGIKKYRYQKNDWYLIGETISFKNSSRQKVYKDSSEQDKGYSGSGRYTYLFSVQDSNYLTGKVRVFDRVILEQDTQARNQGYYDENDTWTTLSNSPLKKLSDIDDSNITNGKYEIVYLESDKENKQSSLLFNNQRDGYSFVYPEQFMMIDPNEFDGQVTIDNTNQVSSTFREEGVLKGGVNVSFVKNINKPGVYDLTGKQKLINQKGEVGNVLFSKENHELVGDYYAFYIFTKDEKFVYRITVNDKAWLKNKEVLTKIINSFQIEE